MVATVGTAVDFCLPNQDEVEICARDLRGKWVVLYFYPKDLTPGCTTQACDFSAYKELLAVEGAMILGVSGDSAAKHRSFIEKKDLSITLLVDEGNALAKSLGVWGPKKFMGKSFDGVIRTTFILDPQGKIAAVFSPVKVKEHAQRVMETLQKLKV
ncbi:MAG: peroxiredoxin [Sulfuricurvum sp. PC08-66]|nr:MAG: peroxiredoxin [Sulfuricurvum sp. PC08-66]